MKFKSKSSPTDTQISLMKIFEPLEGGEKQDALRQLLLLTNEVMMSDNEKELGDNVQKEVNSLPLVAAKVTNEGGNLCTDEERAYDKKELKDNVSIEVLKNSLPIVGAKVTNEGGNLCTDEERACGKKELTVNVPKEVLKNSSPIVAANVTKKRKREKKVTKRVTRSISQDLKRKGPDYGISPMKASKKLNKETRK